MKVLVTGADGFVGRYLVRHLLASGHAVRAGARPGAAPASVWFTPAEQRAIEWVPLELLDADSVRAA
ncbi:MAG: NAD-dependent epimerase/dehydratase family protein, partial [Gemmatimonadota bacterium]